MSPTRSAYPVLITLALIVLAPMSSLLLLGGEDFSLTEITSSPYMRRVIGFSLWQAFLSTLISVSLAIVVARALAHFGDFPLRNLILKLFALPLVVPSVVVVMGIVSVYGSHGWIPLGQQLYGLKGILLAHIFFNLPLSVRLLLPVWQAIPAPHWRISEQLALTQWQQWKYLEWPALRENLPGVALLVFMLCLSSFAVVLTLGGGPRSTTLEVAIYQSLRFDFDPPRAVLLALLQMALCSVVAWISSRFHKLPDVEISIANTKINSRIDRSWLNAITLLCSVIFITLPLIAMAIDAVKGSVLEVLFSARLWQAAAFTLCIGLSASMLSLVAAALLLTTSTDLALSGNQRKAALIEFAGSIVYLVPPLVIGTGLFVLMAPHLNVFDWAIPVVIIINAMMGLPFVIRTLGPAMRQSKMRYQRLSQSLALSGWNRFKIVDWPLLRKPVGLSSALVAALSMGDLGVIALFGTPETTTLPLLLYHQLAAYLIPQAAVTAAFLLVFCLLIFWLLEAGVGGRQHAQH